MTELLERAVETMRGLPPETQDALARILLELAGGDPSMVQLSADDEESLKASLLEAERGEFATDDEIKAIWAKHVL
jgi:predicted transcriptional regulator